MPDLQPNGWNEWAKYVLKSIERLETNVTLLDEKVDGTKVELLKEISDIKQEIVKLQIKAGLWGAAAAAIPAAIAIVVSILLT